MSTRSPEHAGIPGSPGTGPSVPEAVASRTPARPAVLAALVGLLSALVTLAVAELVSLAVDPAASPLLVVGSLVIDLVPAGVKDLVIALFGTNDKIVLLLCLAVLVAALAVVAGVLEWRRTPWGTVLLAIVGVVAVIAATTRSGATGMWASPTVAGVVAGALVLRLGSERLRAWIGTVVPADPALADTAVDRRRFLVFAGATAVGALLVGVGARVANAATVAADAVRRTLTLPRARRRRPRSRRPPISAPPGSPP